MGSEFASSPDLYRVPAELVCLRCQFFGVHFGTDSIPGGLAGKVAGTTRLEQAQKMYGVDAFDRRARRGQPDMCAIDRASHTRKRALRLTLVTLLSKFQIRSRSGPPRRRARRRPAELSNTVEGQIANSAGISQYRRSGCSNCMSRRYSSNVSGRPMIEGDGMSGHHCSWRRRSRKFTSGSCTP